MSSRYELPPRADLKRPVTISCGWDGPLQSFFLQVATVDDLVDDDPMLIWMGTDWREVAAPEAVLEVAALWAEIPAGLAATLRDDQAADVRDAPPPLLAALNAARAGLSPRD